MFLFTSNNKNLVARFSFLITAIFLFFCLSFNLLKYAELRPIHGDEAIFVERTKFLDWYLAGEFSRPNWQEYESFDTPKLAEYFFGAVISLTTGQKSSDYLSEIGYTKLVSWHDNESYQKEWDKFVMVRYLDLPMDLQVTLKPIMTARFFSITLFSIPLLLLLFQIGAKAVDEIYGLIVMVLIGSNKLFSDSMVTAMGDALLWFLIFLFLYVLLFYSDYINQKKENIFLVFLSLVSGLAIATKLNGSILVFIFFLVTGFMFLKKIITLRKWFSILVFLTFFSYAVFFLINPFVWKNPVINSLKMVEHRQQTFLDQQSGVSVRDEALKTNKERITSVIKRTLGSESNYSTFSTNRPDFFKIISLDGLLLVLGLYLLFKNETKQPVLEAVRGLIQMKRSSSSLETTAIFFLVLVVITTVNIPLDWDRYYMPYIFAWSFIQAYALWWISLKLFSK